MSISFITVGLLLGSVLLGIAIHILLRYLGRAIWRSPIQAIIDVEESDQKQLARYGFNAVRGFAAGEELSIPDRPSRDAR